MRKAIILILLLTATLFVAAQQPLYIVNGEPLQNIAQIPPNDIEQVETLPADEQSIAKYGPEAAHGVVVVTLKYDTPASFAADSSFTNYIAKAVDWGQKEPAARVIIRYTITTEGKTIVDKELESTDQKLKRRILKAIEQAPLWSPATKNSTPIPTQGVIKIELPVGKKIPRPVELILR